MEMRDWQLMVIRKSKRNSGRQALYRGAMYSATVASVGQSRLPQHVFQVCGSALSFFKLVSPTLIACHLHLEKTCNTINGSRSGRTLNLLTMGEIETQQPLRFALSCFPLSLRRHRVEGVKLVIGCRAT